MFKIPPMPINEICKQLGITRETFFKWLNTKELLPEFYIQDSDKQSGALTTPFLFPNSPFKNLSYYKQ